ncbi:MAG TPA: hypothetical protein DCQ93_10885 [Bacteroidetes bacterium]|nr:hypothetical protein [Bacteroidota bacterium]
MCYKNNHKSKMYFLFMSFLFGGLTSLRKLIFSEGVRKKSNAGKCSLQVRMIFGYLTNGGLKMWIMCLWNCACV